MGEFWVDRVAATYRKSPLRVVLFQVLAGRRRRPDFLALMERMAPRLMLPSSSRFNSRPTACLLARPLHLKACLLARLLGSLVKVTPSRVRRKLLCLRINCQVNSEDMRARS